MDHVQAPQTSAAPWTHGVGSKVAKQAQSIAERREALWKTRHGKAVACLQYLDGVLVDEFLELIQLRRRRPSKSGTLPYPPMTEHPLIWHPLLLMRIDAEKRMDQ